MKKKALKIAALCGAIALIIGVAWFANAMLGNPISKMLATNTAKKHLAASYTESDYVIDRVSYSFKDGNYYAYITSPSSMDGDFTLQIGMTGRLEHDTYNSRVAGHGNVADRLYFAYRDLVDSVLTSAAYPYTVSIGFGDLEFDHETDAEPIEGSMKRSELVNDKFYDVSELGKKNGKLVLYIDHDTVSAEQAAEILLETKRLMDEAGVSFYAVHFVLQHTPYDAESYARPEGNINLRDFLYSDIYEAGMLERVIAADHATKAYYAAQDQNE